MPRAPFRACSRGVSAQPFEWRATQTKVMSTVLHAQLRRGCRVCDAARSASEQKKRGERQEVYVDDHCSAPASAERPRPIAGSPTLTTEPLMKARLDARIAVASTRLG
jgi:hypothetical protein